MMDTTDTQLLLQVPCELLPWFIDDYNMWHALTCACRYLRDKLVAYRDDYGLPCVIEKYIGVNCETENALWFGYSYHYNDVEQFIDATNERNDNIGLVYCVNGIYFEFYPYHKNINGVIISGISLPDRYDIAFIVSDKNVVVVLKNGKSFSIAVDQKEFQLTPDDIVGMWEHDWILCAEDLSKTILGAVKTITTPFLIPIFHRYKSIKLRGTHFVSITYMENVE